MKHKFPRNEGAHSKEGARQEVTESRALEKTKKEVRIKHVETCSLNCSLESFITQLLLIYMNLEN